MGDSSNSLTETNDLARLVKQLSFRTKPEELWLQAVLAHDMLSLTSDQPLLVLQVRKRERRECPHLFKNPRTSLLPSPLQTHRAERRKRTSPAWICRGCGRTSLDPENWSLSRRIWSHGWYCTGEGDPQCSLGLEPLLPRLHHPQTLCPAERGKKDSIRVLREGPIQPFSGHQVLLPVLFILSHLFNEWASFSPSFLIRSYLDVASCPFPVLHP